MRTIYWGNENPLDNTESDSRLPTVEGQNAAAFTAAACLIRRPENADTSRTADDVRRSEQQQIRRLLESGALPAFATARFEGLELLSNHTSEHEVRYDGADLVLKRTWPGIYGQIPVVLNGVLDRRMATPAEYLDRQALQNEVFDSTIRFEGINISDKPAMIIGEEIGQPAFVISQKIVGAENPESPIPTMPQIAEFMTSHGFESKPGTHFGWFRKADSVAVMDAKPDNFILSREGIVPIDLQMAYVDLP